jgi:hypothetical protein
MLSPARTRPITRPPRPGAPQPTPRRRRTRALWWLRHRSRQVGQTNLASEEAPTQRTGIRPMTGRPRTSRKRRKSLSIFQANVAKTGPAHDCALALADAEQYDIVLLQEPWTAIRDQRCLTKTHPSYDTFSPVSHWTDTDTRPRVMTYVRWRPELLADQFQPAVSRDLLWLTVNEVTVVNVYRQPFHDAALETLLRWSVPPRCLVAGDFNAKHPTWQTGRLEGRGEAIAAWAAENRLALLFALHSRT